MSIDRSTVNRVRGAVVSRVKAAAAQIPRDASDDEPDGEPAEQSNADQTGPERFFDPNPTIAIVVPARNEDRFLRMCLRSIREQYFNSWECIVVDDGSTDSTRAIADEFATKDARFRVVSHSESLGLASARNTGIELTKAPYLTFLDADDFLYQHSLQSRLKALRSSKAENVAGSYCDWHPTKEQTGRKPPARPVAKKPEIVSFTSGPECPFIATAPLVRRTVIEALGGFNEDLPTAEDFDLWIRTLRAGFCFVYAPRIGVAYRQKASGMVFQDTALHARTSDEIVRRQFDDLTDAPDRPAFHKPLASYMRDQASARRLLRSFALAEASADKGDQAQIGAMLPASLPLLAATGFDVRAELKAGLSRAARAVPKFNDQEIRRKTLDALEAKIAAGGWTEEVPEVSSVGASGTLFSRDRASKRTYSSILTTGARTQVLDTTAVDDLGVLFIPMATYHAEEMGVVAAELEKRGQNSTFLVMAEFADNVQGCLGEREVLLYDGDAASLPSFSAVFTMNDWGSSREIILEARKRGVRTIARVEGVQDYRDLDTGRIRLPYQTADYVLAQGENDLAAINHKRVSAVGNHRLEAIFVGPQRTKDSATGQAVINSNFTYGVLSGYRDEYVKGAIRACIDAGLTPVISQHPADEPLPSDLLAYRSDDRMSDLLHTSDVLISRFSTVPFEAIAIGTPFVYFRPEAEVVGTFDEPLGAYEIVHSAIELTEALPRAVEKLGNFRELAEDFFRRQIDIGEKPSIARTVDVILSVVNDAK